MVLYWWSCPLRQHLLTCTLTWVCTRLVPRNVQSCLAVRGTADSLPPKMSGNQHTASSPHKEDICLSFLCKQMWFLIGCSINLKNKFKILDDGCTEDMFWGSDLRILHSSERQMSRKEHLHSLQNTSSCLDHSPPEEPYGSASCQTQQRLH